MNRTHAPQYPLQRSRWPVPQRRRHRSVHSQPASRWPVRAVCGLAIGGVVALGLYRPPSPVDVDRLTQAQDDRLCAVLDTIAALAFQGITPPPDPTAEDVRAVRDVNTQLAQLAEQVRGLRATREVC